MKSQINSKGNSESKSASRASIRSFAGLLPACLIASQLFAAALPALAGDAQLQPLEPSMDTSTPTVAPHSTMLNGQVTREDATGANVSTINSGDGKVIINIQSGGGQPLRLSGDRLQAIIDAVNQLRPATEFNGVSQRARTAEDFRALQYGVIGMVSTQFPGSRPVVSKVFPTSPAENVGIQRGDVVVKANGHVFKGSDGPTEFWQQIAGRADTAVDVTVLRGDELMTFHMSRMNIEDIKDESVRKQYERVLGLFGPPAGDGAAVASRHHKSKLVLEKAVDTVVTAPGSPATVEDDPDQ